MNPTFLLVTDCRPSPPVIFDHQGFTLLGHCRVSFVLLKLLASSIFRWWTWRFKTMFVKFSLINVWESALIMPVWSVTICETPLIACPSPTFNIINDQTIKFSSFKGRSLHLQEVSKSPLEVIKLIYVNTLHTLISLINVTSRLPILKNSTQYTKARLILLSSL